MSDQPQQSRQVRGVAAIGVTATFSVASLSVAYGNTTQNKVRKFIADAERVAADMTPHNGTAATNALKDALEAIHAIHDSERRGEWSNATWEVEDRELWEALLGARAAAHHDSKPVAVLFGGSEPCLRWADDIPKIHWASHRKAYRARLAGNPVIPTLERVAGLLAPSET